MSASPIVIPESIVINGTEVKWKDVPELASFVQLVQSDASQTEKNKLYTVIANLTEKLKEIEVAAPTQQAPNTADLLKDIGAMIDEKIAPLKNRIEMEVKFNNNEYRNRLIAENQDSIVPELVVGDTKEQLDENLIKAKEVYAAIKTKVSSTIDPKTITLTPEQKLAIMKAPAKREPGAPLSIDEQIKALDPKSPTYAADRQALLASLQQEYSKPQ